MTNAERIYNFIASRSPSRVTNSDLKTYTGVRPHQQIFQITQRLVAEGRVRGRQVGKEWEFWIDTADDASAVSARVGDPIGQSPSDSDIDAGSDRARSHREDREPSFDGHPRKQIDDLRSPGPSSRSMKDTIRAHLLELAVRRPLFHSEADFQHEIAWELRASGWADEIRLERRFDTDDGVINLDLLAGSSGHRVALELKYWKKRLQVDVGTERFSLRNQGAHDISRYDFWKDVSRLETLISSGLAEHGFAIALTNDPGYWRQARSGETVDASFRMHDGRRVHGTLAWSDAAGAGTTRNRDEPLMLRGEYDMHWIDYSKPTEDSIFRYSIIEVDVGRGA